MNRPVQKVHIIDGKTRYSFDCVIQAEHSHVVDVLEDAKEAKDKKKTVRYAVLKPSTLQLEVSVLDTIVVNDEPLTRGSGDRSVSAYDTLYKLQRERKYLTVITRMHTFNKMMISDFAVTENPDHQYEMYANIALKEMIIEPKPVKPTTKPPANNIVESPSVLFQWTNKMNDMKNPKA